jgi:5S rRNA maturation endonuclease (ribonuclease M5)
MNKPAFIVEGHSDARQVIGALHDCNKVFKVIVTDGTKMNNRNIINIESAIQDGYTPYILSDPDEAGDHLAEMVHNFFPDVERIFADYEKCKYCKDLRKKKFKAGIEYASYKYLKSLLYPYLGLIYVDDEINWIYL